MFKFITHVKGKANKRMHIEQLVTGAMEIEQEESVPEGLNTEDLVSKCTHEVCHREPAMHLY